MHFKEPSYLSISFQQILNFKVQPQSSFLKEYIGTIKKKLGTFDSVQNKCQFQGFHSLNLAVAFLAFNYDL